MTAVGVKPDRVTGNYGNVWTSLPGAGWRKCASNWGIGCGSRSARREEVYPDEPPDVSTFGAVEEGKPLVYLNSLLHVAFALNQASFAERYALRAGADWAVTLEPISPPHAP
jgi:S-adenosylmethionine hydrolase